MDLRGILNTADNGERPPAAPPVTTPKQPQPPRPQQPIPPHSQYQSQPSQSPSTPSQAKPSYFPEYPHPPHPSPGKGYHPDYPPPPAQRQQSMPYPHSPYQSSAPYPPRAGPPSLQGPGYPDPRSPAAAARPPPNLNRSSTTPLPGGPSGGGYFSGVHTPTEMASPVQQHQQYPPQNIHPGGRDSYGSQSQPGGGLAASGSYLQSPVAQTPTTPGAPGGPHPYPHQRSQSIHSLTTTSTPTSAQSQHAPFGSSAFHPQSQQQQPGQQQRSPIATNRPPIPFNRQQSQPPAGPIAANARQSSDISAAGFAHPSSPHSQRMPSVGPALPQQPPSQPQAQPLQQQQQLPPHGPGPVPVMPSRMSSTHTSPIQHHAEPRLSHPRSDRDRSISISPKSHVANLPGHPNHHAMPSAVNSQQLAAAAALKGEGAMTPAKRKMGDSDVDDHSDRRDVRQRQDDGVNGRPAPTTPHQSSTHPDVGGPRSSVSPVVEKRKPRPRRYNEPPPWALNASKAKLKHPNFEFPKRKPHAKPSSVNGRPPATKSQSRHASPEAARSQPPPPPAAPPPPQPALVEPHAEITAILGPWEPTIANLKPLDEINKAVADFLFLNVISNPDAGEIASLGIAYEIEAKLGTVIDRDTNERVSPMVTTECVLDDRGRFGFQSSMTEVSLEAPLSISLLTTGGANLPKQPQHKGLNEFLNQMVLQADPRNPESGGRRVQVHYKHRREVDRYFELSPAHRDHLPGCVRSLMRPRQAPRARVTYDQRTKDVLAKIIKVRVADMHIHMPNAPVDCRISVNLEMDWPGPVEELEQGGGGGNAARQKDRLSYAQGNIQVDLTQVTMPGAGVSSSPFSLPFTPQSSYPLASEEVRRYSKGEKLLTENKAPRGKEHELEVELSPGIVVEQGRRLMANEPHKYPELVESFVDNVRLLARKVNELR